MRQSSLNVCRVRRISMGTCFLCELFNCETLSAIVRAIAVIVRDLLSACTSNLCKCCVYCYLCFVFSRIFDNQESFTIKLLVELFSPCTGRTSFVTQSLASLVLLSTFSYTPSI
ncbi:hypothetical protein AVEN_124041-1 [Araneus ventricosus]|uniref:Uncharacterized protein n=1 Tax=Araneus ventricosus TaxID=182803 RepID=A0A4Y2P531_ARAVE|nr:hypothetical protein AVEN_124041-1 [Araneus ventricosus]